MFLILLLTNALTLGDGDVEVLFGFGCLYIKEVRALACPHTLCENLILVAIIVQSPYPPCCGTVVDERNYAKTGRDRYACRRSGPSADAILDRITRSTTPSGPIPQACDAIAGSAIF